MNARYVLSESPADLGAHFGISVTDNMPARYNIAPSQPVPIIRAARDRRREMALVRWGFVPGWDTEGTFFRKAIVNIRVESAPEKTSFRGAWARRRCLFPMNAFYEWADTPDGKQPYAVATSRDMPLFALAGLWEHWTGADGSEMETAAFLTREGFYPLDGSFDRMPIFVPSERYDDWLFSPETDLAPVKAVTKVPQPDLVAWPVDRRVNSWKPDDADLVREVAPPAGQGDLF